MRPTEHEVLQEVVRLGTEYPDVIYDSYGGCYYTSPRCGPGSGCIIGQALQNLGWTVAELKQIEKEYEWSGKVSDMANALFPLPIDDSVVKMLQEIQRAQDNRVSWGRAVGQCSH